MEEHSFDFFGFLTSSCLAIDNPGPLASGVMLTTVGWALLHQLAVPSTGDRFSSQIILGGVRLIKLTRTVSY